MNDNSPTVPDARSLALRQVSLILAQHHALLAALFASNRTLIAKLGELEGTSDQHIDTLSDWMALQACLLARHRLAVAKVTAEAHQ